MNTPKLIVCKIDYRICWVVYLCLQILIIACMVGSLGTKNWVKLDLSYGWGEDFQSFEGSIMTVTNYNGKNIDLTYKDAADYYCNPNTNATQHLYSIWCDMFNNLDKGGKMFIICDAISISLIVAWGFGLIGFIFRVNCFAIGYCVTFSCCSLTGSVIAHLIAVFSYLHASQVNYSGNCDEIAYSWNDSGGDNSDNSFLDQPSLCIKDGPALATFVAIFWTLVWISYWLTLGLAINRYIWRKGSGGANQDNNLEIPNSLPVENAEQLPIIVQGYPVIQHHTSPQEPIQEGIPYPIINFNMQPTHPCQNSNPILEKNIE